MSSRVPAMYVAHPARLAAISAGEKYFDPGVPCWHGHQSKRRVCNAQCAECYRLYRENKQPARSPKACTPEPGPTVKSLNNLVRRKAHAA